MKKILFLCLLFLLMLSLLLTVAHATETEPADGETEASSTSEESSSPSRDATEDIPPDRIPLTAALSDFFKANGSTLLGVLTLLGSLLVAFFYKAGLLPMVRAGLSALKELIGKSHEATERFTQDANEIFTRIEEQTKPTLALAERSITLIESLEERLGVLEEALRASESDRRATAAVLRTETELFYELLHSVNLPEAQKESMTESYYRLKRELEANA